MKVLIADDDQVTTRLLAATFIRNGWQALVVHDAMQTLMYAGRAPMPDVILLDINMPGGTGYHALERLKASSRTSHIPVIVITGSTDPDAAIRAQRFGAADFFRKAIEPRDILGRAVELATVAPSAAAVNAPVLSAVAGVR